MAQTELQKLNLVAQRDHLQSPRLFYDWFCTEKGLAGRARILAAKVRKVLTANERGGRFDPAKCYVFYKNNCPMADLPLYDDFRICDMETGGVLYTIVPAYPMIDSDQSGRGLWERKPRFHMEAQVWGRRDDGEFDLLISGTFADVMSYFFNGR